MNRGTGPAGAGSKVTAMTILLTPRERDLVRGVIAGRTNHEMAHELGLTEQAVKNGLSIVYQKCHVRNRLELALFALRHQLISD